jgi:NAD(P)-dependent dehydrogenase (short-subunit alcohol dehydrogenase family)
MTADARAERYALVTGGTSGIGFETARGLSRCFDVVGIVGRNEQRVAEAAEELRHDGARVETFRADFASLLDVQRFAGEVAVRFPSLGVLVNNAGVWHRERHTSEDGYEETFAVNHLAHFLLTNELKALLTAAAPARVINVSSSLHARPKSIQWDDLMFERRWRSLSAYSQSKLANVLFSNELARRWRDIGVTSNALNPGNVRSRITRNNVLLNLLHRSPLARLVVMTEAEGARAPIHLATSPELEGVTGCYFDKLQKSEPSEAAQDREAARRLWETSDRLVRAALS